MERSQSHTCRLPRARLLVPVLFTFGLAAGIAGLIWGSERDATASPENEPQWKLAVQAYTFNRFSFFEAIDKANAAKIKYIEAYPGQWLTEKREIQFNHDSPISVLAEAKRKLEKAGVTLLNYGVVGLGNNEEANRKVFDFAKVMGIETIVSEPEPGSFKLIDQLAKEYGINVAIHNHPKPSRYWNPDIVLEAIQGCSKRIGACADTGHWMRSEINPLEAVKKLDGRIISSHFKDLNKFGGGAHDVIWGTGKADAKAILSELHRQGFKGVFSIEYEHNWENSLPEVTACARFFEAVTKDLKNGP